MADEQARTSGAFDVDELYYPKTERSVRHLPRLLVGALRLVWSAARRQLILSVALQTVGSASLAAQVLIAKQLLAKLLADNTTKDFSSTVPSIVLLAAVLAVASVTTILRTELQRLLAEMVGRSATQQVVDASCRADLARFEDPRFHDRLQRAIVNANIRPLQMTTGLMSVGSSALGVVAVGAVLLTIDPLFFALEVVAAVPLILTSLRVGRALYRFAVEQTPPTGSATTSSSCWWTRTRQRRSVPTNWEDSSGHASPHSMRGGYRHCANWSAIGASRVLPAGP
jgi:ATP-binding cassette subfamily B protein